MKISAVKGFADVFPGEVEAWQFLERTARQIFASYNFSEIRIPILEKTELFSRSLGETTDIVEKEMYTFADQDAKGSFLTLRPEGTAGVVRAYVESEIYKVEPVRKLYYIGPMFRRERPQKGRMRQFHQIGAEALGRGDPYIDAEILLLLRDFFSAVDLTEPSLQINSLGDYACRPGYRETLLEFLRQHKDSLCAACREHFETVQRLLRQTGVGFTLNPRMVRGLDYYCRTTFEWTTTRLGSQSAIAAGGRYDGLVQELGGPAIPGVGFALGVERLTMLLRLQEIASANGPELFVVWVGARARDWAFPVVHRLRQRGVGVEIEGEVRSLKSQMRRADKLKAGAVLIVG